MVVVVMMVVACFYSILHLEHLFSRSGAEALKEGSEERKRRTVTDRWLRFYVKSSVGCLREYLGWDCRRKSDDW
ncbi:hypothetical protein E2C01_053344 [Portunus trituberculatus]|uniref:Secreted protein n=1 Tax=Portunus trituberculatus TaxID=210409 RepID=A0A5B7GP73_PORTR|nr:hypothetical protein [Portunus trituberculatus]